MESQSSGKMYKFNDISIDHLDGKKGFCLQYDIKRTNGNWKQVLISTIVNLNIPLEFQEIEFPANNTEELMAQFILYFENKEQEKVRGIRREKREMERAERDALVMRMHVMINNNFNGVIQT